MKILDRYILRSLLTPFVYCLLTFCSIFVIWDLFNELSRFLEAEADGWTIALYYAAVLLPSLEFLMPASLMLGTLYALWHLTRTNELMAIQASGISFYRVVLPCLGMGLAATLFMGVIKETIGVHAFAWTKEMRMNRFKTEPGDVAFPLAYLDARYHRLWLVEGYDVRQPRVMNKVKITEERTDGSRRREIFAKRAEWLDGRWWLHEPSEQHYDAADNPIGGIVPAAPGPRAVKEYPDIREHPDQFVRATRDWLFLSTWDMLKYLREHPHISAKAANERRYDIHNRLAMPWACLIATLFAIPAGAKTGRHNPLTGIFVAVGFFFAYYMLSQVGLLLGKSGLMPPWAGAWLSNAVFLFSGVVMLIRLR